MNRKVTIILNILCMLLCGGFAYYVLQLGRVENTAQSSELNSELEEIDQKIVAWSSELEEIQDTEPEEERSIDTEMVTETDFQTEEAENSVSGGAVTYIFFTGIQNMYSILADSMGEKIENDVGLLAVGEYSYPGYYWYGMSTEEYEELLDSGWTSCLYWGDEPEPQKPDKDSLTLWYGHMQWTFLEYLNEDLPDIVYFAPGTYSVDMNPILADMGISTVIHHGEDGLPLNAISFDEENGITQIGDISCNDITEEDIMELKENLGAVCISFGNGYEKTEGNLYNIRRKIQMVYQEKSNGIRVLPVGEALNFCNYLQKEKEEQQIEEEQKEKEEEEKEKKPAKDK